MQNPAELFRKLSKVPLVGRQVFARGVTLAAPYFASIHPEFLALEPGRAEIAMRNRRAIQNHLGTVHAIAMCNLCELAAGTMIESTLPPSSRWIPKGMTVRYLHKAETDLVAKAHMDQVAEAFTGDIVIAVRVYDKHHVVVMEADITMYVTPKKR